uniref:NAD(P)(+)--arginine ADP-ribosyltransferase n=1 Tax=Sinocyclocheilus rhinocerous TaxID=307959 RepID=A0A673NR87_9TELE
MLQDHRTTVEGQIFPLDMAPNSVDDQYNGCREKMANLVETKYMKQEMSNSESKFANAWKLAEKKCKPGNNLTKTHSVAIYVYTSSTFEIYKDFNNAVRNEKKNQNKKLKWKKKLVLAHLHPPLLIAVEQSFFGNVSCFEIYTYDGADVTKYFKLDHEKEVLIPPYETFKFTAVKTRGQKYLWCETSEIMLLASRKMKQIVLSSKYLRNYEINVLSLLGQSWPNGLRVRLVTRRLRVRVSGQAGIVGGGSE